MGLGHSVVVVTHHQSIDEDQHKDKHKLVKPGFAPASSSTWPEDKDLDQETFDSMVLYTSFSVDGGEGGGGLVPDTPVKRNVFGQGMNNVSSISMGGLKGWMMSLPDWGGLQGSFLIWLLVLHQEKQKCQR